MVGSTQLSHTLDPETLRELMRNYQQACREVIDKYSAHVAQYLGDGLMVYFGFPRAHEDDAERAARVALFRAKDKHHGRVRQFLEDERARLVTTLPIIAEACYFLNARGKLGLMEWIRRGGVRIHPIANEDLEEIAVLLAKYSDQEIDFPDASLIWLADRLRVQSIMTIDRGDFDFFRVSNGRAFDVVLR